MTRNVVISLEIRVHKDVLTNLKPIEETHEYELNK